MKNYGLVKNKKKLFCYDNFFKQFSENYLGIFSVDKI